MISTKMIAEIIFFTIIILLVLFVFFGNFILIFFIKNYLNKLKIKYSYKSFFWRHVSTIIADNFQIDTFWVGYGVESSIGTTLVIRSQKNKLKRKIIMKRKFFGSTEKKIVGTKKISLKFMTRPWIYDKDLKEIFIEPLNRKYVIKSDRILNINKKIQEEILKLKPDSIEIYNNNIKIKYHKIIPYISKNKFIRIINLLKKL